MVNINIYFTDKMQHCLKLAQSCSSVFTHLDWQRLGRIGHLQGHSQLAESIGAA